MDRSDAAIGRLKKRREFLAAARAASAAAPAFVLQARRRSARDAERLRDALGDASEAPRIGFTASKKVGNAVTRNRAKRRLRALADEVAPQCARPGWDYVLIARVGETVSRPFKLMREELLAAFERAHSQKARGKPHQGRRSKRSGAGASSNKGGAVSAADRRS